MGYGDWDFSDTLWSIVTDQYVSPPSSLYSRVGTFILSRRADCQVLPQGQIVTYLLGPSISNKGPTVLCRNQAALGSSNNLNGYYMYRRLDGSVAGVGCIVDGTAVWSASFGSVAALLANTWYQFRFTWWIDGGTIRFRLERWITDAWVQEGADVSDPANRWAASGVNRVGLSGTGGYSQYYDDTEIWGV